MSFPMAELREAAGKAGKRSAAGGDRRVSPHGAASVTRGRIYTPTINDYKIDFGKIKGGI